MMHFLICLLIIPSILGKPIEKIKKMGSKSKVIPMVDGYAEPVFLQDYMIKNGQNDPNTDTEPEPLPENEEIDKKLPVNKESEDLISVEEPKLIIAPVEDQDQKKENLINDAISMLDSKMNDKKFEDMEKNKEIVSDDKNGQETHFGMIRLFISRGFPKKMAIFTSPNSNKKITIMEESDDLLDEEDSNEDDDYNYNLGDFFRRIDIYNQQFVANFILIVLGVLLIISGVKLFILIASSSSRQNQVFKIDDPSILIEEATISEKCCKK